MPAISASAPGKIILFGEHAVVYGQPAIAVPVTQVRARAIVTAEPRQPAGSVRIQAPIIGLEAWLAELLPEDPLASVARLVFAELGLSQPPALTIRVTSTIPVAAGLGSGAAVSVAIIRALSEFLGRRLPAERVSALAYEVEKLHHGTPSGIDNTVIAYARPVYFVRRQEGNLIGDPRYVSATDFHLQAASPAIGLGLVGYTVDDFDGTVRDGKAICPSRATPPRRPRCSSACARR